MQNLLANFKNLGRNQLIALGVAGIILLGTLGLFVFHSGNEMTLLYGNLDMSESAQIIDNLSKAHIKSTTNPDGTSVYVPRDKVASARLLLAKEGLPGGSTVGYELFDKSSTLTSTQFEQNVDETRALEGELERSIRLLHGIRNVRVNLVLPHRDLFSTQVSPSQASVVLDIGRSGRISPSAVQAIQNLVAAAVPGLRPQNISIVDTRGDVLVKPGNPDSLAGEESTLDKIRSSEEQRLSQAVEEILIPTLGMGHIRARASVTLSTDEIHETDKSYDPNQQVLRSQQTTSDKNINTESTPSTSVANNLPNAQNQGNKTNSTSTHDEETDNYEIGERVRVTSQTRPRIARISVAVLVDGTTTKDKNGKEVWKPLDKASIDRITELAKTAIGYDKARGDEISVVSMPFLPNAGMGFAPETQSYFTSDTLVYLAEWVVPIVLALGALFIALRPASRRNDATTPTAIADTSTSAVEGASSTGNNAIAGKDTANNDDKTTKVAGIDGEIRTAALNKVIAYVDENSKQTAFIIRNWIQQHDDNNKKDK